MKPTTSDLTLNLVHDFLPVAERMQAEGADHDTIMRAFDNYIGLKKGANFAAIRRPPMDRAGDAARSLMIKIGGEREEKADSATEVVLYNKLVQSGIKFSFQVKIGRYRADFVIGSLIVEVDGPHHANQVTYDQIRDKYLRKMGYTIMRVPADLVALVPAAVVQSIKEQVG